ncbi:hypothetical protein EVAR_3125_1 [Eumeta japonica]|uniref:Uncharacterized protein n=1 Tax=Eumeta variegata TaxID=151549 RepID=A0A4C1XGY0_EUMVA|nr:hypothetical protein EVAR_3125_1 [Eumeta japonica]
MLVCAEQCARETTCAPSLVYAREHYTDTVAVVDATVLRKKADQILIARLKVILKKHISQNFFAKLVQRVRKSKLSRLLSNVHEYVYAHARTHACTHARTHARTLARSQREIHTERQTDRHIRRQTTHTGTDIRQAQTSLDKWSIPGALKRQDLVKT